MNSIEFYESRHIDGNIVKEHHHACHQILYVLDGKGRITLDGSVFNFDKGSGTVIVPFSNHSIVSDAKLTVLVLAFDESCLDEAVRRELLGREFNRSKLVSLSLFGDSEVRRLLRKLLFEKSGRTRLSEWAILIHLEELLLILARHRGGQPAANANILRAEKIRGYIESHYFEISGANDICVKLGISARHVINIFKEKYEVTPLQYLNGVRMELARKMLSETEKDIVSICFELGFENLSTFYRTFKAHHTLPPQQFRRLHGNRGEQPTVAVR